MFFLYVCSSCSCSPADLKGKCKHTTAEEGFEEYELSSSESSDSSLAVNNNTKKLEVRKKVLVHHKGSTRDHKLG